MNIIEKNWDWAAKLEARQSTKLLIFHHAAADCTAEAVHRYHLSRGWAGIGYHYFVGKDGSVTRGRPEDTVGAHCVGKNYCSIAVCFEGNFENDVMGEAQKRAGAELIADIRARYPGIETGCHSDFDATACPGRGFPLKELTEGLPPLFPDMKGHWAKDYVEACAEQGLLKGREDGLFHPDEYLTRAELAAVIGRMLAL
jgi:N-acetyl-anhydromuramyl-L-alanine amidase AmpD